MKKMTIKKFSDNGPTREVIEEEEGFSGFGLIWEADSMARAIRGEEISVFW